MVHKYLLALVNYVLSHLTMPPKVTMKQRANRFAPTSEEASSSNAPVFKSASRKVIEKTPGGQGFQSVGFREEQRSVTISLIKKCE